MASPSSMADTNVPVTPAEVGCQILLTDKLIRDNQEDIIRAAGRILGDAMEVKRDGDLLTLLDNGTTSLGGSSSSLTLGAIAAAQALLGGLATASGGPAPKPYVCVHHPYVLLDLVDVFSPLLAVAGAAGQPATGGAVADEVLRNYFIGRILGMNVYEDGNLTISSTATKGGVFASGKGGAIILATADEWDVKPERDESLRATELNIVGEYGVANYLNGWTVELHNDATTPA